MCQKGRQRTIENLRKHFNLSPNSSSTRGGSRVQQQPQSNNNIYFYLIIELLPARFAGLKLQLISRTIQSCTTCSTFYRFYKRRRFVFSLGTCQPVIMWVKF